MSFATVDADSSGRPLPLSKQTIERANQTRLLLQETVEQVRPRVLFGEHRHQKLRSGLAWNDGTSTMIEVLAPEQSRAGNLMDIRLDPNRVVEVGRLTIQVSFPA